MLIDFQHFRRTERPVRGACTQLVWGKVTQNSWIRIKNYWIFKNLILLNRMFAPFPKAKITTEKQKDLHPKNC